MCVIVFIQTYSSALVNNAKNWTSYCDADATVYSTAAAYPLVGFSATPPDQVAVLATAFNTSDFYYGVSGLNLGLLYTITSIEIMGHQRKKQGMKN